MAHPIKRRFVGRATKRAYLVKWLQRDRGRRDHHPPCESLAALVEESERAINGYLRTPKALRPVEIASQLTSLTKHLTNAARVASTLGGQGWLFMAASSGVNEESGDADFTPHVLYLERLAAWSIKAAETAEGLAHSALDHRGGRTPDYNLRSLVAHLCNPTKPFWLFTPSILSNQESPSRGAGWQDLSDAPSNCLPRGCDLQATTDR